LIGTALTTYKRSIVNFDLIEAEDRFWQHRWDQQWSRVYVEDVFFGGITKRDLNADPEMVATYLASEGWLRHNIPEHERRIQYRAAWANEVNTARDRIQLLLWGSRTSLVLFKASDASLDQIKRRMLGLWPTVQASYVDAARIEECRSLLKPADELVGRISGETWPTRVEPDSADNLYAQLSESVAALLGRPAVDAIRRGRRPSRRIVTGRGRRCVRTPVWTRCLPPHRTAIVGRLRATRR
jgi:hypothetical protein